MPPLPGPRDKPQTDPGSRPRLERWRWAVGIVLLALLVWVVGPRALLDTLRRVSPSWALSTAGIACVWLFVGGLNVWLLLRCLIGVPLGRFFAAYMTAWSAGLVLPGQLGDATQILFLREYEVPAASSGAAYVADKSISLFWLALVAAYGVGLYALPVRGGWLVAVGLTALAAAAAAVAAFRRLRLPPTGLPGRLQGLLERSLGELVRFRRHPGILALNVSLSVVKWVLMALLYWTAFRAFGRAVGFEPAAVIPVMGSLVGYLPVTVGGAGTTELTAVVLFGRLGVEAATVLGVFLFVRAVLILIAALYFLGARRGRAGRAVAARLGGGGRTA